MRDPSRIKLEEYGWEMTEEIQRGEGYHSLNRQDRRALDSSCELPGRRCLMTKPYGIAVRLVDQSRYDLAERQLRQSLQENPEHAAFHQRLGRKREAEAAIAQALMLDPDNDFTHTAQGWRLVEKGDRKAARAHFLEALRINPENRWAQSGLQQSKLGGVRMWIGLLLPVIGGGVHVLTAKTPLEGHPANFLLAAVAVWVVIIALAAGLLWIRDSYPYTVVANVPQGKPTGS
jgi:tetratricopeptide (TPR) repeat protein